MLSRQTATRARQDRLQPSGLARLLRTWFARLTGCRSAVVSAGLAAAILLPPITISARLPDARVEQLLLPYAAFVILFDRRAGLSFRLGLIDWVFAGLAASTLLTVVCAPLLLHTRVSPRDFYELLKVALYYALYRLAISSALDDAANSRLTTVLLFAGAVSAAFGVFQYFDWLHVNAWLTPRYAPDLHLNVLRASGRAVGTIGNPNYFGIFCAIVALGALAAFWISGNSRWAIRWAMPAGAAGLASLGIVMSGSRTALLALGVSLAILLAVGVLKRTDGAAGRLRLAGGAGALIVFLLAAIVIVETFPRGHLDYLGRVGGGLNASDDASVSLRLARWRSVLGAWLPGTEAVAGTHYPLTPVHATGVTPADPAAIARDLQRKADLLKVASAIDSYHHATGRWPAPSSLAAELGPSYLTNLPADPSTGEAYADIPTVTGYSLMARLENPADADFPIYGIGSSPNYLLNGDLEKGGGRPSNWDGIPGSSFSLQRGDSLYGDRAVLFRGEGEHGQARTGIYQQRYFGRPGGNPFTATVWVKLLAPAPGQLQLYANAIYSDGDRADPLTRIPADMSKTGVWQRVSLGIQAPAGKSIGFLGIYAVSDGYKGQALLDGFQLVDGPVPLSFAITREAPPSDTLGFNPEAKLRRSPLIGVGPEKGEQGSSLDDEYILYAARYGTIGIALYLALYLGTLTLAVRRFLQSDAAARALAATVALTLVAFLIFNIAAGSFYELQLMAIFWLLAGTALSIRPRRTARDQLLG